MGGIFDVPSLIFVFGGSFFALFIAYPMSSVLMSEAKASKVV